MENYGNELYHYGVLGMKWGIHKANRLINRENKLQRKAAEYDLKSSKARRTAENLHSKKENNKASDIIGYVNKLDVKANKLAKKNLNTVDEMKKLKIDRKVAKLKLKSKNYRVEANRIIRDTPWGGDDSRYAEKADKYAYKAEKARFKLTSDKKYIAAIRKKMSEISSEDLNGKYSFVKDFLDKK